MVFEQYLSALFIVNVIVLLYGLYYVLAYTKVYDLIFNAFATSRNRTVFHSIFFRLSGFVIFGLVSAFIFYEVYDAELDFLIIESEDVSKIAGWTPILCLIAITVAYINVRNSKKTHYPQFKLENWTLSYKFITYSTWVLYLAGYEFMFRGILLFGTVEELGYYPAIILNVTLYAVVHIHKGWKEVLGCFILGPILCITALKTNSLAIPIAVHLSLCLSNEFFSIRKENLKQKEISLITKTVES